MLALFLAVGSGFFLAGGLAVIALVIVLYVRLARGAVGMTRAGRRWRAALR